MPNNETPGNGGLIKEFYEAFQKKLKDPLLKSFYHANLRGMFYITKARRTKTTRRTEKKGMDKKVIQELETNLIAKYWSKMFLKTKLCRQ